MRIDLNIDIGEGFPYDEGLLAFASSANVCCGEHAGSWDLTAKTVQLCIANNIRIGAHPGYPDRQNMGRRDPESGEEDDFRRGVLEQVDRFLADFSCSYIKPHGAWYNALVRENRFATGILEIIRNRYQGPIMMLALPGERDPMVIREGFADRAYTPEGTLVARSQPGAILTDPELIARQVLRLAPTVDSICLHGDTQDALVFAELVYRALIDAGYEVGA